MIPFREWSNLTRLLVTIATGGAAIIGFVQVAEPYTPATRGWVRGFELIQSTLIDNKLAAANAETKAALDTLTYQNYDIQLSLLTSALQILKGEEIQLMQRLKVTPTDSLLSNRLNEVQSNIRYNEQTANALRCEVNKKKGWPCGPR